MASMSQQRRRTIPLDDGPGERVQTDRQVLLLGSYTRSDESLPDLLGIVTGAGRTTAAREIDQIEFWHGADSQYKKRHELKS